MVNWQTLKLRMFLTNQFLAAGLDIKDLSLLNSWYYQTIIQFIQLYLYDLRKLMVCTLCETKISGFVSMYLTVSHTYLIFR